ncbi:MAG: cbb3-type cytochrome c oxidase subunit I, partial [Phenylobacterium sp.]
MSENLAQQDSPPGAVALLILSAAGAFLGLMATALSPDPLFRLEGWIFTLAALAGAAALTVGVANGRYRSDPGRYEDGVIRAGAIATLFWAIVGMLVGVVIALQLAWPRIFYFPEFGFLNFGRLRPLHTSGVIFAFGGNALIAT